MESLKQISVQTHLSTYKRVSYIFLGGLFLVIPTNNHLKSLSIKMLIDRRTWTCVDWQNKTLKFTMDDNDNGKKIFLLLNFVHQMEVIR